MMVPVELVLDLVDSVQSTYRYGLVPMPPDRHPLAERFELSVCRVDRPFPVLPVPAGHVFRLPVNAPPQACHLVVGQDIADRMMNLAADTLPPGLARRVRDGFALVGILNLEEWRRGGDEFLLAALTPLVVVDPVWYRTVLPDVVELAREVVLRLARLRGVELSEEEERNVRLAGARALLRVAKTERGRDHAQALAWYELAAARAQRAGDMEAVALALIGTGNVLMLRREFREAKGCFLDALDMAQDHGLTEVEGMACHDLLALSIHLQDHDRARLYANRARNAFRGHRKRLPRLALDIACWMVERAQHGNALPVLRALRRASSGTVDPLCLLCTLAKAAAGCGFRDEYVQAYREAVGLLPAYDGMRAGEAFSSFVDGACLLGEWEIGAEAAVRVRAVGVRQGALLLVQEAVELERRVARREGMMASGINLEPVGWAPDADLTGELVEAIAALPQLAA